MEVSNNEPSTHEKHHFGLRRALVGLFAGYLFGVALSVIGLATSGSTALYPSALTQPFDFLFSVIGAGIGYYSED
jgi:divalent metal cation (Fe/Co/Zn/Cd) transporter